MRDEMNTWHFCKSIAVMGGTFDPIHYGHLVTADAVRHKFNIERIIFVPTGLGPHKENRMVTHSEHRYLMTVLATVSNDFFDVSRLEIDRDGFSYTVDTVCLLKNTCSPDAKIYFIVGADAVHQILTWKDPRKLFSICEFIAVSRPGFERQRLFNDIEVLRKKYESKIHFIEVPALDISSSDIRERVFKGMPIKYLIPEEVENYIYKFQLYKNKLKHEQSIDCKKSKSDLDDSIIEEQLRSSLSIERYIHTCGVVDEALKLAAHYGCNARSAKLAALLHDCAKNYPNDLRKRLCKEYHVNIDDIMKRQKELIHSYLGAEVAKRNFNIVDEDILNAIRYHTTGRPNMSCLEKIIFLADFIEPGRESFDGMSELRRLSYENLNRAMEFALDLTIKHVKMKKRSLHPLTQKALNYYKNLKEEM